MSGRLQGGRCGQGPRISGGHGRRRRGTQSSSGLLSWWSAALVRQRPPPATQAQAAGRTCGADWRVSLQADGGVHAAAASGGAGARAAVAGAGAGALPLARNLGALRHALVAVGLAVGAAHREENHGAGHRLLPQAPAQRNGAGATATRRGQGVCGLRRICIQWEKRVSTVSLQLSSWDASQGLGQLPTAQPTHGCGGMCRQLRRQPRGRR